MAIKFGDILENINAKRPIVDLIENNAKGLLFVSEFDDDSVSPNNGVIGIPKAKRSPGSLVLDKTDGILYCWPGVFNQNIDEHTANGDDIVAGSWEDTGSTSKWIEIGTIKKRTNVLAANINDGPDQLSEAYDATDVSDANILATVNELRTKINELITNPPRTFGKFLKGQELVKASDTAGLTALQIIERAVTDILPYTGIETIATGAFQYYQPSGSSTVFATGVTAFNYDSLNDAGENIVPTSIRWYYRLIGDNTWLAAGEGETTIQEGTFTDSITATATITGPTINWTNSSPANVDGIEFKLELRDNSDEDHLSEATGADGTNPVVYISPTFQISESNYVHALGTLGVAATNDETGEDIGQPFNWSGTALRSKGNFGSTVTWGVTGSTLNGAANTGLTITDYAVQYRNKVNGTYSAWANATGTVVSGSNPNGSGLSQISYSGVLTLNTTSWSASDTDSTQFRVTYTDASGTHSATVTGGLPDPDDTEDTGRKVYTKPLNYRLPIFVGFADVGGSLVETDFDNLTITEATIKGLTCRPGGLQKGVQSVAPGQSWNLSVSYGTVLQGHDRFPLLVEAFGHADSADNVDMIYTPDNNFTNELLYEANNSPYGGSLMGLSHATLDTFDCNFGWLHNKPAAQQAIPDDFPDALLGGGDTRLIMAVPDGGPNTSNHGLSIVTDFQPTGVTSGTLFDNNFEITNSFGASKRYVVSVMDTVGAMDSVSDKRMLFKIDQL